MYDHEPSPIKGYSIQSQIKTNLVNEGKELEERYLRWLDKVCESYDGDYAYHARKHIEIGSMWATRAIFRPDRISLPEDN